ncbi:MAG: OmpH family outer membrane protein [Armatimonadota bacterium]
MNRIRRIALIVSGVFVFSTLFTSCVFSQTIGVVDEDLIYSEAPKIKQYMSELDKMKEEFKTKLDIRSQTLMLNETEINEIIDLKMKAQPTAQEKARIAELEAEGKKRDEELRTLIEIKDPNDQQRARLKELQDIQTKAKNTGQAVAEDYDKQWQAKVKELDQKALADIDAAVKEVAQAKGLSVVLAKAAVYYGGVDITQDVIQKLPAQN